MLATAVLLAAQLVGLAQPGQLYASGGFERARRAHEGPLVQRPGDPGQLLRLGVTRYELRQFSATESAVDAALRPVPDMHPALAGLGTTWLVLGKSGSAVPILALAAGLVPQDASARRPLGHALANEKDLVKREPLPRGAVEENPRDHEAWLWLGMLFFGHNYNAAVLAALCRHLALCTANVRAPICRADALTQLGRFDEAGSAFEALA